MVQTLSQQGFGTASPSGAMGPNGTPSGMTGLGLGVDLLGTPGGMATTPSGMNMSMAMGMGMVPSMSELGLTLTASGGQKRNEDEERRAKMRRILKKIGRPRGRVSEEGICRVGRRVGFANDIDAEVLTAEERERKVGNRTVSIAGEAVVVDVDLKNHVPREVQVMLSGEGDGLVGLAEKAGEVLLGSLRDTDNLEGFAKGLDWIAKIDRLGGGKVNGFEALGGIFGCLRRLCDEEVRLIQEGGVGSNEQAEIMAMCRKSGRPSAHARGGLGIALDYWQDDRAASSRKASEGDMEIDSNAVSATNTRPSGIHTLHLDLDRCPPEMYPPIRITSAWLPEKLTLESTAPIPWQEPDATFVSSADADENMADNNIPNAQQKLLPSLRFLAKLDPPVVLPWQTATTLMTSIGAVPPQHFSTPPLLHHVLLPTPTPGNTSIERQKTVLAYRGPDSETEAKHVYRLHVAKPDFGFKLEELPFAHPKQLVDNLPTLRQWGCFGALVQDVFSGPPASPLPAATGNIQPRSVSHRQHHTSEAEAAMSIDVSLATSPSPVLSLSFPTLDDKRQIGVELTIGLNGDVAISGCVGDVTGNGAKFLDKAKARKWAKGLKVCGAVAVWVEWIRGEEMDS